MAEPRTALPIDPFLPGILQQLREVGALVLSAEPGAGKTTRVPRALFDGGWAERGEIIILEPRRLAARLAATRVAEELGEPVGRRVGYQVRFDDKTSADTRIRFLTEGLFIRRLARDPGLSGVSVVVLDEFHERHLHTDLALAFVHDLRRRRPDLHVVCMSATLDAEPVSRFLGAPWVTVPGRPHRVEIEYAEPPPDRRLEDTVRRAVSDLLRRDLGGDVLVFLPGAAEIRRAAEACGPVVTRHGATLRTLHGDMPVDEQAQAIRRERAPKVILSTNVAETSVTIEGVVAVVDSGLARVAEHSPWSGLPALVTAPISQAAAEQRAGRAGRLREGVCVRLYGAHDLKRRPAHEASEIARQDLAEMLLLLRCRGHAPGQFVLLEQPRVAALEAAEKLLTRLRALEPDGAVTEIGHRLLALPLHPRLGRILLEAEARSVSARGCLLAALLNERDIVRGARSRLHAEVPAGLAHGGSSDPLARLEAFEAAEAEGLRPGEMRARGLDPGALATVRRTRDQLCRLLRCSRDPERPLVEEEEALLTAVLVGFPDRVARRRRPTRPEIVFSGGGSATLSEASVVTGSELMVALEATEHRGGAVVHSASAIEPEWLLELFPEELRESEDYRFDKERERVEWVRSLAYDGLVLDEGRGGEGDPERRAEVLAAAAVERGVHHFCDPDAFAHWCARLAFVEPFIDGLAVPDDVLLRRVLRDAALHCQSLADLRRADLLGQLKATLSPRQRSLVERLAPESVVLPGRRRGALVQYEVGRPPWLASRIQDFFGLRDGPQLADGRVPVVLHLLAPNGRAVQVTTDLRGFWERHYPGIRKTLMRRYPRHAWPENPPAPG